MLQLTPNNNPMLIPPAAAPDKAAEFINTYIETHRCEIMCVDISFMNVIDSCYVSAICSAKHYLKYPAGKINWKISSDLIREFNKGFELGNMNYI